MALLVLALFLLEPWLIILCALLFLIWPSEAVVFTAFLGEIWAIAFAVLGVALLRRIRTPVTWPGLFRTANFYLAVIWFGLAIECKLLAIGVIVPMSFAVFYQMLARSPNGPFSIVWNAGRAILTSAATLLGMLVVLALAIAFSVAHSVHNPFAFADMLRTFTGFIMTQTGFGTSHISAASSGGFPDAVKAFSNPAVLVILLGASIALVWESWAYIPLIVVALGIWHILPSERYELIPFNITIFLGAQALQGILARLFAGRGIFKKALAIVLGATAAIFCLSQARQNANASTLRAFAGLTPLTSKDAVAISGGLYFYHAKLIEELRRQHYVLASGFWQFPEISTRWGLQFYDRLAPENAHLWNQQTALLLDKTNHIWPLTSQSGNCASVIYIDGPLILCRPRKDVPLSYQAPIGPDIESGLKIQQTELATRPWILAPNLLRSSGGPHGSADFEYTGTGAQDSSAGEFSATLVVPVQAGKIYSFSAWVDPSNILNNSAGSSADAAVGMFDLFITSPDRQAVYSGQFWQIGPPVRYSTDPWRCPPGVTRVMLVMGLLQMNIAKGEKLKFAAPVLVIASARPATRATKPKIVTSRPAAPKSP